MKIIINNVYAFQYPTKNRCTILVQPSFAKLVLLPIREAYEWKRRSVRVPIRNHRSHYLLPIREAYEWKLWDPCSEPPDSIFLLPIREAYEWKLSDEVITQNVNALLPIREAYEWKRKRAISRATRTIRLLPIREAYEWKRFNDYFFDE